MTTPEAIELIWKFFLTLTILWSLTWIYAIADSIIRKSIDGISERENTDFIILFFADRFILFFWGIYGIYKLSTILF